MKRLSWFIFLLVFLRLKADEPSTELRGLWIATVANIDWPSNPTQTPNAQQEELLQYLDLMAELNMNCVFFQVRPAGDALYVSEIEPWSEFITGAQGTPPNPVWDPLEFITEEAHAREIEVHAWINPFRAKFNGNTTDGLDPLNMALRFPQYAYPYGSFIWMDPSAQVVLDHLYDVVNDILTRYDVDGLHIDDYFYPEPTQLPFPDEASYDDYLSGGGELSLEDWRRSNINSMVQDLYILTNSYNRTFSVSPAGLYRPGHPDGMPPPITGSDPYETIFADSKLWLASGWLDWFIPQIYWAIEPPQQSFPAVLDWWLDVNSNGSMKLVFAGTAVYKIEPPNDWSPEEITRQVEISRQESFRERNSLGNVHFSAKYFRDNTKNITALFRDLYSQKASIPRANGL